MRTPRHPALVALLGLPSLAYGAAVRLRNRILDRPGAARRAAIPVISVGNLTVGGTGKTPFVAWLVRRLQLEGRRPAVVTRGYGGRAGKGPLRVSDGSGPRLDPRVSGDEPYLLARSLPGAQVIAGSDRLAGAMAAAAGGADVVVLDDGFQHRRLARDLDLVLLDASSPFGNYWLLPAGPLREPISGLERADAVILTRSRPGETFVVIERVVRRYNPACPIVRAGSRRLGFFTLADEPAARPSRAVAFSGIGNPAPFLADLEAEGVEVAAVREFTDHHRYTAADWRDLESLAARHRATLVTTEKDLNRVPPGAAADGSMVALRIEADVHEPEALMALVRRALGRARP